MFGSNTGYSLADIAAATGGSRSSDNGWGGDGGAWWIIILFLFCFAGWGNGGFGGFGGGGASGALTRADLCQDMNFAEMANGIRGITSGLCDGFYAMNTGMLNGFSGVQSTLCQGFAGLTQGANANTAALTAAINADTVANMQNTNALSTQLANCCCENREGQAAINYNLATQSCDTRNTIQTGIRDILDNQNAGVRAILDKMCQQEIAAKDAQIAAQTQQIFGLQLAASQQAQNAYLISELAPKLPVPAYTVPNPFTGGCGTYTYGGYGYGCGCN